MRFINSPITMSSAQVSLRRAPPARAANEDVLRELAQLRIPQGAMSVHLRIENHVATVTLARPDVLNAVDLATEAARNASGPRSRAATTSAWSCSPAKASAPSAWART